MPRFKDDLGLVCAPCVLGATWTQPTGTDATAPASATPKADDDPFVLDLDDVHCEEVVVELTDDDNDDADVVDLSPEEVRAALRSAVTSAVSTIVRDETRAALDRARGRVD